MDRFSPEAQSRMVQYLVSKYGLLPTLAREYERLRKADQRDMSGTMSGTGVRDIVQSPTPITATSSSVSSSKFGKVLSPEALGKAKALLKPGDYEFLQACPEPFRSQWLDGEWWVS